MTAPLLAVADAVVTLLNAASDAGTFSQEFRAERLYVPVYQLADEVRLLKVTVLARGQTHERADRGNLLACAYLVDVGVQKRVPGLDWGDKTELDALMGLAQELADYLWKTPLSSPSVKAFAIENDPAYDPAHLEELRQFTSVLTVTYRQLRAP